MKIPASVQKALAACGLYTGKLDGDLGPLTMHALMCAAANVGTMQVDPALAKAFVEACPGAEITNRLRILHAIAQACVETAWFRSMVEIGSSIYFAQYDGRYGNKTGEGYLYRGRGLVMLTFHDNYAAAGKALALDLVNHPDQAAQPQTAAAIFAWYWTSRHLGPYADADDLTAVTRKINGGLTGLQDRRLVLDRLKAAWPA